MAKFVGEVRSVLVDAARFAMQRAVPPSQRDAFNQRFTQLWGDEEFLGLLKLLLDQSDSVFSLDDTWEKDGDAFHMAILALASQLRDEQRAEAVALFSRKLVNGGGKAKGKWPATRLKLLMQAHNAYKTTESLLGVLRMAAGSDQFARVRTLFARDLWFAEARLSLSERRAVLSAALPGLRAVGMRARGEAMIVDLARAIHREEQDPAAAAAVLGELAGPLLAAVLSSRGLLAEIDSLLELRPVVGSAAHGDAHAKALHRVVVAVASAEEDAVAKLDEVTKKAAFGAADGVSEAAAAERLALLRIRALCAGKTSVRLSETAAVVGQSSMEPEEWVARALDERLLFGSIDQMAQTVFVAGVAPRNVEKEDWEELRDQLSRLTRHVEDVQQLRCIKRKIG